VTVAAPLPQSRRTWTMASPDAAKPLKDAAKAWKAFDLRKKSNEIDTQILKIYDKEQASTDNRKKLAKITRELGTLKDQEKLKAIKPVIRSYQKEIDYLTRRATFSENALISIYKGLCDVPDPCIHLENALTYLSKLSKFERELVSVRTRVSRYEEEFKGLKNQELTVKTLKEQNQKFLRKMDEMREGAKAREQQLVLEESQALKSKLALQEKDYQQRLDAAQSALTRLTVSQTQLQSKLYDVTNKEDDVEDVTFAQSELLSEELEAARAAIACLTREKNALTSQLHSLQTQGNDGNSPDVKDDDADNRDTLARSHAASGGRAAGRTLDERSKQLERQLQNQKRVHLEAVDELNKLKTQHEVLVLAKDEEIASLKQIIATLPSRQDHKRLKKRVVLLQEMGFNVVNPDIDAEDLQMLEEGGSDTETDRTREEMMILREARRMKNEMTKNKVGWSECKEQLSMVSEELQQTKQELKRKTELVEKLEEDLSNAAIADSTPKKTHPKTSSSEGGSDPKHQHTEILKNALGKAKLSDSRTGGEEGNERMLAIIVGQRDRFRKRIQQLESEAIVAHNMRKDLQSQIKKLRGENINLYEKLQFTRSYKSGAVQGNAGNNDIEAGDKDSHKNPFQVFKQKQREAKFANLSPQEKIIHRLWEMAFSKNSHRFILFAYSLFLHFLVFFTLWRTTHQPPCPPPR